MRIPERTGFNLSGTRGVIMPATLEWSRGAAAARRSFSTCAAFSHIGNVGMSGGKGVARGTDHRAKQQRAVHCGMESHVCSACDCSPSRDSDRRRAGSESGSTGAGLGGKTSGAARLTSCQRCHLRPDNLSAPQSASSATTYHHRGLAQHLLESGPHQKHSWAVVWRTLAGHPVT